VKKNWTKVDNKESFGCLEEVCCRAGVAGSFKENAANLDLNGWVPGESAGGIADTVQRT
jgi:hypothetical protein